MTRSTNYEDDLFALSLIARGVRDIIGLDVDADLFAERVAADASFAEATALRVLAGLRANPFLVNRAEHLKALQKLLRVLAGLFGDLSAARSPVAAAAAARAADLPARSAALEREAESVAALLEDQAAADPHVVSAEELRFLTAPAEEG